MKKFLSLLVIATLICSILISCGKKDVGNEADLQDVGDEQEQGEVEEKKEPVVYRTTGSKTVTLNPHIYQTSAESDTMSLSVK